MHSYNSHSTLQDFVKGRFRVTDAQIFYVLQCHLIDCLSPLILTHTFIQIYIHMLMPRLPHHLTLYPLVPQTTSSFYWPTQSHSIFLLHSPAISATSPCGHPPSFGAGGVHSTISILLPILYRSILRFTESASPD